MQRIDGVRNPPINYDDDFRVKSDEVPLGDPQFTPIGESQREWMKPVLKTLPDPIENHRSKDTAGRGHEQQEASETI
jgi:hypothetical protein